MKKSRLGLTLIELVVVMAILGALAAMLLPKFEGLQSAANHTAAAGSVSDLNRLIGVYKTSKTVYPDKWDSLMGSDGAALWTAGNAGSQTKGLHTQITGDATVAKLTVSTLSPAEALALNSAGINTVYKVPASIGSSTRAGDAFNTPVTVADGMSVAVVNTGSPNGKKIIDRFYRQNAVNNTSGLVNGDNSLNKLVVFGVGPLNSLIPNSMMEAPTYGQANATYVYNRLLVVFQVATSASGTVSVTYKGALAADGDLLDDMSVNMQTGNL